MERLGLLAGNGKLPIIFSKLVRKRYHILAIGLKEETDPHLKDYVQDLFWVRVGELGSIIEILKKGNTDRLIMVGGIDKTEVFSRMKPDEKGMALLARLHNKNDDNFLRGVAEELEKEGIKVTGCIPYLSSFLTQKGNLTERIPTQREKEDIDFGWRIAKEIGKLDIGQTVVVKDKAVLAVESFEGTDETIKRGGKMGKGNVVVVKVIKPCQDLRFDFPVIGPKTVSCLKKAGATCLAIEAEGTVILEKEKAIRLANREGVSIVGI